MIKLSNIHQVHFLTFSIIPLLLIFSFNVQEISITDIFIPILVSIAISIITFFILKLKFDFQKSSLILSVFLICFLIYGNIRYILQNDLQSENTFLSSSIFLGFIFIFISLISIYYIFKKNIQKEIHKIFSIFSITLVLILIPNIMIFYINNDFDSNSIFEINLDFKMENRPDVFVILADEFAGPIQLSQDFDYYPTILYDNLKIKNFQIVENALSNYPNTAYSLPSTLNMDYLEFIPQYVGEKSKNTLLAYELRNDNNVMKIFKKNGYKITSFYGGMGSVGDTSLVSEKPCAPFNINNDLKEKYFQIYIPFTFFNNNLVNNPLNEKLTCIQNHIKNLQPSSEPQLHFIHLRLPHSPFVFDSNGNFIQNSQLESSNSNAYLEQLIFTENTIVNLVNDIQENDPDSAIIIFSDHGFRSHIDWSKHDGENLIRGHNVIVAYNFPNVKYNLPENLSLVNLFRIFFNQYSNEQFELLENKFFWYDPNEPNNHFDVTNKILDFVNNHNFKN